MHDLILNDRILDFDQTVDDSIALRFITNNIFKLLFIFKNGREDKNIERT